MQHSKYSPSSMNRTVNCNGSVSFTAGINEEDTEEKREGDAAHYIAQCLLYYRDTNPDIYINNLAPNGVILTDEMYDAALTYYNEIMLVASQFQPTELHVEEPINIMAIHLECFGTPDAWLFNPVNLTLYLWDFKYGHLAVNVVNNYQLISYTIGILDLLTGGKALDENLNINIKHSIVSPRVYDGQGPVRSTTLHSHDLRAHFNIIKTACANADEPDAQLKAGSHCIGCLARFKCPALLKSVSSVIDYSTDAIPVNMTPEGIAYELQLIELSEKLLKYRKESMQAEALKKLREGVSIPGYMMEQGYSNRKWKKEVNPASLSKIFGINFIKEPEPRTPAQSCLLLKSKGYNDDVLETLFERVPTSLRLKYDDNSKAKRIFSEGKI